jgi:UDP-3-O-[3-hydroxymyristoyl] N-acetylglucosamine deacetylase/3-hydroxyacyl-[acyl-carrier-protein] dehydratase
MSQFGIDRIMELLPHRYPFLLVDKVVECDEKETIVAIKNVTVNEPFFQGHFPNNPVMPGVLQIEAMAQVGGLLMIESAAAGEKVSTYLMSVDAVKFRRLVRPGDQLRIEVKLARRRGPSAKFAGRITVDGQVTSEAEIMCMVVPQSAEKSGATATA